MKIALTTGDKMVVKILIGLIVISGIAAILTSCDREDTGSIGNVRVNVQMPDSIESGKTITFTFDGITHEAMTRATLTEAQMTDLWVFDYVGGSLVQTIHQVSTDEGFSTVSLTADYGDHQLYFVASRGDTPAIDGTTISWSKPSDTFWQNVTLNVEPQTEPSQAVSLQRVATRLRISITDEVPTGLASIAVTPSVWYYGLDYTTGEATDSRTTARTVSVPASYVGTIGQLSASFYCISQSAAWQTNLSITAKGSDDATMASVDITGVPMQRNRITTFSGRLFSASRGVSVSVDDSWDTEYTGTW